VIDRIVAALVALLTALVAGGGGVEATTPAARVAVTVQVATPPPTLPDPPAGVACPEWFPAALEAGWTVDQWPNLGRIMFRESRCDPGARHVNANGSVDRGLLQINSANRGFLAGFGIALDALFDGPTNLVAGRRLFDLEGWRPWSTN
jgi:hypothetical protein